MSVCIIYDPYNDEYAESSTLTSYHTTWSIDIFDNRLYLSARENCLEFTRDGTDLLVEPFFETYKPYDDVYIHEVDRIVEHFKYLIREIFLTGDTEKMIYLYKSLFPLLNRTIITQRMIDEYELPK